MTCEVKVWALERVVVISGWEVRKMQTHVVCMAVATAAVAMEMHADLIPNTKMCEYIGGSGYVVDVFRRRWGVVLVTVALATEVASVI